MTDREILEFAAKACGYRIASDGAYGSVLAVDTSNSGESEFAWNPFNEDGDALRLAVKLGMFNEGMPAAVELQWQLSQPDDDDPYIGTRRAIVRTAADIGYNLAAIDSGDSL